MTSADSDLYLPRLTQYGLHQGDTEQYETDAISPGIMSLRTPTTPSPSMSPSPSAKRALPTQEVLVGESCRRKAKTAHEESPFIRFGRHYVRTIEMFSLPSVVITHGLLWDPDENPNTFTVIENRHFASFQALVKLVPVFALKVDGDEGSPEDLQRWMDEFAACLQLGASGAKSDDTRSLRGSVIDWLKVDFPADTVNLNRDTKVGRGFRNKVTGRLLCPVMLDWNDESVRTELLNRTVTIDGEPVNGSHWPAFLYASGIYNESVPWVGFLMGENLLRTYLHIFISPSSAKGAEEHSGDGRATRSGNAANYGMTEVTKASIAYAAAQLYFALSDSAVFNKHQKNCDALGLYNAIRDYLEDPEFKSDTNDLLAWWNRHVFPAHHVEKSKMNHGLAHMRAARAAARSSGAVTVGGEDQQQDGDGSGSA